MNVLIVEDDPAIGKPLRQWFKEAGLECVWATDGDKGLELASSQQFDVVVLDLMLPGRSGLEVLRSLRTQGIKTPVIILTAREAVENRVEGLRAGADDYLVKPFATAELMARIQAVCRRLQDRPAPTLKVGDLVLDRATRQLTRAGVEISLSPTEYRLVELFMQHPGQVVTRQMLFEHLWDSGGETPGYIIDVHINRLRTKLDRHFDQSFLETVRGRGYVLRGA
jgi:two-component system, OmpR family, response regulator